MQAPRPAAVVPVVVVIAQPETLPALRHALDDVAQAIGATTVDEAIAVARSRPTAALVLDLGAAADDAVRALRADPATAEAVLLVVGGSSSWRREDGVLAVDRDAGLLAARIEALVSREAAVQRRRSLEAASVVGGRFAGEHLPTAACACDADGRIRWANPRWRRTIGEAATWFDAVHPAQRHVVADRWRAAVSERADLALDCPIRVDGGYRWQAVVACPRREDGLGDRWVVVLVDVHRRHVESEALNRAEREMRLVADALPALVAYVDADQRYRFVNRTYRRWFGRGAQSIVGRGLQEILGDGYAAARPWFENVLRGEAISFEAELPGSSDERRDVAVEYVPDVDERGGVRGFVVLMTDITARKRAEREATEARTRAERAMGDLAAKAAELERGNRELEQYGFVVSHDLQEPLRMVRQFLGLLRTRAAERLRPDEIGFVDHALDGASRMEAMIRDLLAYARAGRITLAPEPVPLDGALGDALAVLARAIDDAGAAVEAGPLPAVRGDRARLTQVLQNLVGNALKFRSAEPPRIRVDAEDDGDEWIISVADNGIGIPVEERARVFEMFQRLHTRSEYPGSGIGLSICQKIVNQHGGRIWIEAVDGGGSRFRFTLPAGGKS